MHRSATHKLIPLLLVFTMLAMACSRVPPGGELSIDGDAQDGGTTGFAVDPSTAPAEGSGPRDQADARDGSAPRTPDGGTAGATTTGGTTGGTTGATTTGAGDSTSDGTDGGDSGATTTGATGQEASGPGIEGDTIEIVFHWHFEDCPQQDNEPNDATRTKTRLLMEDYTAFFNQYVLADHGWQLAPTIVDDGGFFCPERQRATAIQIAKEIQPFAVLGNSTSAQGPIIADTVTRAGILHIGTNFTLSAEEAARHPYAWNTGTTAEKALRFMVGWMERRVSGTPVPDRSIPGSPDQERVYGILGLDDPEGRALAKLTGQAMTQRGMDAVGTYLVAANSGVAAQQAPTTVAKMRDDGVNTLVWGLAFGGGKDFYIPFTNAMDQQNYLPDILLGTGGNAFFEQFAARRVWANARGTSSYPPITLRVAVEAGRDGQVHEDEAYTELNENFNGYVEAWHKMGHNDLPYDGAGQAHAIWTQLSMLAAGIIHAGDSLNPGSWARGLESAGTPDAPQRCTVDRFMGRDYRHVLSYEWNGEHDGGTEGFTTVYWVNRQSQLGTNGYYESSDNYEYFRSPQDIPREPTHDTGVEGPDVRKQERIGIRPWTPCSQFPDYPAG